MKKLNLSINSCTECPYFRYDPDYGNSYDSGYDCIFGNGVRRVIDDHNILVGVWEKLPIPEWCPIPDVPSYEPRNLIKD